MVWVYLIFFLGLFAFMGWKASNSPEAQKAAAEKAEREKRIVCAHCHTSGHVTTRMQQKKAGISGGKATGAVLTGGVSLLATGLARKGWVTTLKCGNCGMQWDVAA